MPLEQEEAMNFSPLKYSFILIAIYSVCFMTVSGFAQGFAPPTASPPSLRWETDLNVAMARAEREQRPLFLHFIGNDCQPAVQMANEVFVHPGIVSHLNTNFVMVQINASANTALAQRFEVTAIPTDLVIKPNGQLVHRRTGGITAERFTEYLLFLQKTIASETGVTSPPAVATIAVPPANPAVSPNPAMPPSTVVPPQREAISIPDTIRDPFMQQAPAVTGPTPPPPANSLRITEATRPPVEYVQPVIRESVPPAATAIPVIVADEPTPPKMVVEVPLALEGFCPVTLCSEERWVSGNPAYCTLYQGHIFRFASLEAIATFARNPANYMPIAMGEDIVFMVERNKRVNGNRKFGAWFQGRVFLFSSQETLDTFAARPEYYTEIALKYELARKEQPMPIIY